MKSDIKTVSGDAHDSILRDFVEGVKQFSWDTVWLELSRNIPSLMSLLSQIIPRASQKKPLLCFFGIIVVEEQAPTTVLGSTCCVSDALRHVGLKNR